MAEYVLAYILARERSLIELWKEQENTHWNRWVTSVVREYPFDSECEHRVQNQMVTHQLLKSLMWVPRPSQLKQIGFVTY